jgi:Zn-dependent protease
MFGRGRSIKLMTVSGIRIGVDGTWFFMLFLLIFILQGSFRDTLDSSDMVAYLTTVVTVLLFFVSLIVHELGHAFAARREGIAVSRIELFLFGGTTHMARDSNTPSEEFKIAAAGPLGTLLFIIVCLVIDLLAVGPHRLVHAIELDGNIRITPLLLSLSWLVPMNVLILVFNLIPAYPLDGGRIARAAIWRSTGDKLKGTRYSARIGEYFAIAMGLFGIYLALRQHVFEGLWIMILASMIWQSARYAVRGTEVPRRVEGVRIGDIMDHEPVTVLGTASVERALEERFHRYGVEWLPVIDGDGYFIGIVRRESALRTADEGHGAYTIGMILEPGDAQGLCIDPDRPLTDALTFEPLVKLGALIATDASGRLRGVITLDQVRRVLQTALSPSSTS